MAKRFPGFPSQMLTFFRDLEKNNDRNWFAAHKETYEQKVRQPMIDLITLMMDDFRKLAADYVPDRPDKIIYRIYRDTRFSKDKTPYKTHIGVHFQHRRIPKNRGAGFYFEVSHQSVGIGGGIYMPGPDELQWVRSKLAGDAKRFATLCADKALVKLLGPVQGESAVRIPKGFEALANTPAADWVRRKQIYFFTELDAKLATTDKLYPEVIKRLTKLLPFNDYLNQAIIAGMEGQPEPDARPVRPEPMF